MKKFSSFSFVLLTIVSLVLSGCGGENSTNPVLESSQIEGQLVADSGIELSTRSVRSAGTPGSVYPVSGATVELIQNGVVMATTTSDEYGRFQFDNLAPGEYDVRVLSGGDAVAHYHAVVTADQTLVIYGRVVDGECLWDGEYGPQWDEMPQGAHWGEGFLGAAPGQGYWHDGQEWCDPQGNPQGTGPHGSGGGPRR